MGDELKLPEPLRITALVTSVFELLKIQYFIAGSFASIVHGVVRTTQDADIVAKMNKDHVRPFVEALEKEFFVDREVVKHAVTHQSSFNILHKGSVFKIDIFVSRDRPFDQSQYTRARKHPLLKNGEPGALVATAEDTLLAKLDWYSKGGEVSERQWRDALGIVKIQGNALDFDYLDKWSQKLGIRDLLDKLLSNAKE